MELVDSYLAEVGRFLPQDKRDEILAELREDIVGEVEGRAEAAGRAPRLADQSAVLGAFGHPLKVAGRYQPPRYVIGPDLYPAFMQTLKVLFAVAIFAQVIVALVISQTNQWHLGPGELLGMCLEMLFWIGASVIAVFIVLEYSGERFDWYKNWRPEQLARGGLAVIKRGDVVTNLIGEGFFLLWWNDVLVFADWLPRDADGVPLSLSAAWDPFFWWLNVIFAVCFVSHFYVLVRGIWQRLTLIVEIAANTALLAISVVLLNSGPLINPAEFFEPNVAGLLQLVVNWVIVVIGGFAIWDIWLATKPFRGTLGPRPLTQ